MSIRQSRGRIVDYLRVSVTDRCDFRCTYCMNEDVTFLPRDEVLSLDETARLCGLFIRSGVRKLRVTGGEPLLRRGVMDLFTVLSGHLGHGLDELTLTTNGSQLDRFAAQLADCGVRRVNVSLDTLDADRFAAITRTGRLDRVLAGIKAAKAAGLKVKINTVALKGVNDGEIDDLIRWSGEAGDDLTLIEQMPFGEAANGNRFLPLWELRRELERRWTLEPCDHATGGPARYVRVAETGARLGFITPLTDHFCDTCNRVRLSAVGRLHPCLGHEGSVDLRDRLRGGAHDETLRATIQTALAHKPAGHDWLPRGGATGRSMNLTGG
jgi:cyclic pyranopterin phosphate synthase